MAFGQRVLLVGNEEGIRYPPNTLSGKRAVPPVKIK